MKTMFRNLALLLAGVLGGAGLASAQGSDPYATLLSAVQFTNVTSDVIAVAALVVVVLVAIRAVRFIFQIVRR